MSGSGDASKWMVQAQDVVYRYEADEEIEEEDSGKTGMSRHPQEETAMGPAVEDQVFALNGVSLSVKKGEFVCILGHNGSGKSTLARHLNALLLPVSGTVYIEGMDTQEDANIWLIRQKAGMIFQNPDNQLVDSIVEDDIAFGPENLGMEPSQIRLNVDEALKEVNMEEYRKASPNHLSGGQKQRIAIAGVLAMKPDCIVLDEPTAMLDPRGRADVMQTLKRLNKEEGMTIIHITHYMEEAVEADRVVVMDQGKVVMTGTPREVFSRVEELKHLGLDVPPMTELSYLLRKDGIDVPQDTLTVDEMVEALCRLKSKT